MEPFSGNRSRSLGRGVSGYNSPAELSGTREEDPEIAEYIRVKDIFLGLLKSRNPEDLIHWTGVAKVFGFNSHDFKDIKAEDFRNMLHASFGTDTEAIKGIGVGNIYLGYAEDVPVAPGVTREFWDFIPKYNYPSIRIALIDNPGGPAISIKEMFTGDEKNELAKFYFMRRAEMRRYTLEEFLSTDLTPPRIVLQEAVSVPAAQFQEEETINLDSIETTYKQSEEVYSEIHGDLLQEVSIPVEGMEKILTVQEKAQKLLQKMREVSQGKYDEKGRMLKTPRYFLTVDDVLESLAIDKNELSTSTKFPYILLMSLMPSIFPMGMDVEVIDAKKKSKGMIKHTTWRIKPQGGMKNPIEISLVSLVKGRGADGLIEVVEKDAEAFKLPAQKIYSKKVSNGYYQMPLMTEA